MVRRRYREAMRTVRGVARHYDWGDDRFIPELLGLTADGRPWAEWWVGTHPEAPATLDDGLSLESVTGRLPWLLKVLSAARPLSMQTHPDAEGARRGFEAGVFGDPNPKPELLLALTPFVALCGVRPIDATTRLLRSLGLDALAERISTEGGVGAVIVDLYRGRLDPVPIIEACRGVDLPEACWVVDLDARYPGEPSVAVALLLNLVELLPGEALRLDAGNLHAYLAGSGVELMGASDNVVRGGLTSKPVDVDLLLATIDPTPLEHPVLPVADRYELPAAGVALARVDANFEATEPTVVFDLAGRFLLAEASDTSMVSGHGGLAVVSL